MHHCKNCKKSNYTKAGFVMGEQRFRCKDCGCQFVPTRHHGKSEKEKLIAVWLYSHGFSFRTIAKFLKISVRSAYVWVKTFAENNHTKPIPKDNSVIIELDEMWHFLNSKKDKFGSGKHIVGALNNSLIGSVAQGIQKHLKKCIND
jgi:transposase